MFRFPKWHFKWPRRAASSLTPLQALALHIRALNIATQARRYPVTMSVARAWLTQAATHANKHGLPNLAQRITAMEQGIL